MFESVQAFACRTIGLSGADGMPVRGTVMLSYFPYATDHTTSARYLQFRLRDEGNWLLHGHTHAKEKITSRREIHVGLDAWNLRPVSLTDIVRIVAHGEVLRGADQGDGVDEAPTD